MVPWSEVNLPISRVAGGEKLTGPPSHLDLVLPESGAVAQKRYQQQSLQNIYTKKMTWFWFLNQEKQHQVTALTGAEGKQVINFGGVKFLVASTVSGTHIYVWIHKYPPKFSDKKLLVFESGHILKTALDFWSFHLLAHICDTIF